MTSIQYLLFLTLQGKETHFRGHKLTQNKVQKKKIKAEEKFQHSRKNMEQVLKNNKFRKTKSRLGQENPKKEVEPIAPTRKSQTKFTIGVPLQVKIKLENVAKYSPHRILIYFLQNPCSSRALVYLPSSGTRPRQNSGG